MENKLEQLLNSLVKDGWNPRGYKMQGIHCSNNRFTLYLPNMIQGNYSIRDLVSKSSGLWQFVCENNLVPIMCDEEWIKHYYKDIDDDNLISGEDIQPTTEYEYYLIESALLDEDKLEEFLLNSIKLD